jgi:hypothetical protein
VLESDHNIAVGQAYPPNVGPAAYLRPRTAQESAIAKMRESEAKVADNEAAIAKAQAGHSAKLKAEQVAHDQKCANAWAEIEQRDRHSKTLNSQAALDAAATAQLKSKLEAKLKKIEEAQAL